MIVLEPFDLESIGLTVDDLDLGPIDAPRALPLDRPRWRRAEWWATTEGEAFHHDLPDFESAADRGAFMVERMARTALVSLQPGTSEDDAVFPHHGRLVSLCELLAGIRRDVVDDLLDLLVDDDAA